jgi:hypothetical protein
MHCGGQATLRAAMPLRRDFLSCSFTMMNGRPYSSNTRDMVAADQCGRGEPGCVWGLVGGLAGSEASLLAPPSAS